MNDEHLKAQKNTILTLIGKKQRGEVITMLTACDYPMALAIDRCGADIVLVGDSLGMVALGYETTLPVTMEEMLHHSRAVSRAVKTALLVGDMPFMSYQASTDDAVRNAGRFLQEAGMDAVKLEGGRQSAKGIEAIVRAGIPVMGHIGLTPQSVHLLGGWKVQGRSRDSALRLIEDACLLQDAGCFALVLEAVPDRVAGLISRRLAIPTIGIGAGAECDGQVLVTHDLLGLYSRPAPRFARKYVDLLPLMKRAFGDFFDDVRARRFPSEAHSTTIDDDEYEQLLEDLQRADTRG